MEIFLGFLLRDYLFIILLLLLLLFLAWLLNKKDGCDNIPDSVTHQASMKLSPPHQSPTLPCRGPHHHRRCSPPRRRHCSVRAAGTTGTAGTADSPAQGE